jgi:hypothetical protein
MNLTLEKQKLIEELNATDDIYLIKAIREMLNYAHHIKDAQLPLSDMELTSRIERSEEDIANGRTISLEQVRKKYKQ